MRRVFKGVANKYTGRAKTQRQHPTSTMMSGSAESSAQEQQDYEQGTMGRISKGFRNLGLRPQVTDKTFQP